MATIKPLLLVVDDQLGIRRLLTEILSEKGYSVIEASDGYNGLQKAKECVPALILLDMKMPRMDGITTLQKIKSLGLNTKVIMMTAYGELNLVDAAKELGAAGFVTKPFDIIALCAMIEQILAHNNENDNLIVSS